MFFIPPFLLIYISEISPLTQQVNPIFLEYKIFNFILNYWTVAQLCQLLKRIQGFIDSSLYISLCS